MSLCSGWAWFYPALCAVCAAGIIAAALAEHIKSFFVISALLLALAYFEFFRIRVDDEGLSYEHLLHRERIVWSALPEILITAHTEREGDFQCAVFCKEIQRPYVNAGKVISLTGFWRKYYLLDLSSEFYPALPGTPAIDKETFLQFAQGHDLPLEYDLATLAKAKPRKKRKK